MVSFIDWLYKDTQSGPILACVARLFICTYAFSRFHHDKKTTPFAEKVAVFFADNKKVFTFALQFVEKIKQKLDIL
ncbi:MAG: hypothetical protein J6Y77_01525 [Paludibacteraceae bacterium]|nr:hypothetical protein [Paludibacteraceae bacterium]